MYRARAESVKGTLVYADGKWLTCIGNKPVHVGDLIYTDGRCVYGFYRESQQPQVITSEIFGIPIIVFTSKYFVYKLHYFTFSQSGLEYIKTDEVETKYSFAMANDTESTALIRAGNFYNESFNADDSGNFYEMNFENDNVNICKNGKVVASRERKGNICWSFIEDENNWAYIDSDFVTSYGAINYTETYPFRYVTIDANLYYCDSNGVYKKLANFGGCYKYMPASYDSEFQYSTFSVSNLINLKLPIQDGYYYVIDEVFSLGTRIISSPSRLKATVYDPAGNAIFSDYFWTFPYFTIYKISRNSYLVSVTREEHAAVNVNYEDGSGIYTPLDLVLNGLYLCDNGELKKIDLYDEVIGYPLAEIATIVNQRLRPMKHFKKWTDNIVNLEAIL